MSSQYLTALMLIGPLLDGGLRLRPDDAARVGAVRRAHGRGDGGVRRRRRRRSATTAIVVPGRPLPRAPTLTIEPDASSASYPLAMAAVAGGRVRVAGLRRALGARATSAFADLLGRMGCTVDDDADGLVVERDATAPLRGIDVDMADISDLVPTLAAVAATASTPTTITGVGFIRAKESDRLGDLAAELAKTGAARRRRSPTGCAIDPAAELHGAALATAPRPPPGDGVRRARRRRRPASRSPTPTSCRRAGRTSGRSGRDPGPMSDPAGGDDLPRWSAVSPAVPIASPVVAAFDVDGTLTTRDCVVPFLRRVGRHGRRSPPGWRWRRPASLPALARRDRDALKAVAARVVFAGRPAGDVEAAGRGVRRRRRARRWLRPRHASPGCAGTSAPGTRSCSCRRRSAPTCARSAARLGVDGVVATELDGRRRRSLHGRARSAATAAAPRRSRRLHAWLDEHHGGRAAVELWAYGDSPGDRELLADADHAVWAAGRR